MNFPTTSWSLVLAAGRGDEAASQEALERLCQAYWYPVYVYIRSRQQSPEDARDLTQEFFFRLLDRRGLHTIETPKGRFRWFLQAAIKNFLANEYDRSQAQKRGGGRIFVNWEMERAEDAYRLEPADTLTPERIFDRRWSLLLLNRIVERLREEYQRSGRADYFDHLKDFLMGEEGPRYRDLATTIHTTEGAVKVAIHRLRRRFGEILRSEIAETVANEDEVEEELRFLAKAIKS